jgi:lipopolysaccharide/colanic/teichoic acid biosynthesis glycosyltransferase
MESAAHSLDRGISAATATADGALSPWLHSRGKRAFDCAGAIFLLAVAGIPMLAIAAVVRLTSRGPVLFRHRRAGLYGSEFELLKFRTMRNDVAGPGVTRANDPRVTAIGRWLRASKLDELPQLLNVLRGELSLVGPRPDLLRYLKAAGAREQRLLLIKPGITGAATLRFRHEEELLANYSGAELEQRYVREVLPVKAGIDLEYAEHASLAGDLGVLAQTVFAVLR